MMFVPVGRAGTVDRGGCDGQRRSAALFAATLHTLVHTTAEWTHRPSELLARMNRLLFEELSGVDMFITAQLVLAESQPASSCCCERRSLPVVRRGSCRKSEDNLSGRIASWNCAGRNL